MDSIHRRAFVIGAIALVLLLAGAGRLLAAGEGMSRSAILAGGGRVSLGAVGLQAAIAQPVAGTSISGENTLCSGVTCVTEAPPAQGGAVYTVTVSNFAFAPDPLEIEVGDTVVWQRLAGTHNVQSDDGSFSSGPASSTWSTYQHTFTIAGTFGYHCIVHGAAGTGMHGTVIVRAPKEIKVYLPLVNR